MITARLTSSPRKFSATPFTSRRTRAWTCSIVSVSGPRRTAQRPSSSGTTSYGKWESIACTTAESKARPTSRLAPCTVWVGLKRSCPLAFRPTTTRWRWFSATIDGVVL